MDSHARSAIVNAYNQSNAVDDYQTKNALIAIIQAIETVEKSVSAER